MTPKPTCFDVSIENHVAHIRFNRPAELNTFTPAVWDELPAIVKEIDRKALARVIVVSSTGKHFTAGMDLAVFTQADGITRTNRHSFHPLHGACEMDEGEEACGSPVVSGCEAAEVLEPVDAALDLISHFVERFVVADELLACPVRRDDGLGALCLDERAQGIAVIGLVGEDVARRQALEQGGRGGDVALLARRNHDPQRSAARIDDEVDLGRQSSSGTPQRLIARPPFPPAACWWARTRVVSSMT